jgi:hypothetical protein
MAYDKVKKNVYYDPPDEYPHSSRNHAEDFGEYFQPLGRLHHAAAHDRGVAAGLEVTGAAGAADVVIAAGAAVDLAGQLIVLSDAGHGDIGADPPNGNNNEQPVPVHLPLASQASKTVYVTIQFSQILRAAEGSGGRLEQVPWLRLQPTAGAGAYVDDGVSVILAIVVIDAAGNLSALKEADGALPFGRRAMGLPAGEVRVRRSRKNGNQLQETLSGRLKPGTGGGLQMTVPNAGDAITLAQDGGANCGSVELRTNAVLCKDGAGREVVRIDTNQAWIRIGAQGNEGDLLILDQNGNLGFAYDGDQCRLDIGAAKNAGHLYMRNSSTGITVHLDGNASSVNANNLNPYGQDAIDVGARFFRIHGWDLILDGRSGGNKRALVDWGNKLIINYNNDYANGVQVSGVLSDEHGVPLMGNPARKAASVGLFCNSNGTAVQDIDLGSPKQFTAFVSSVFIDPLVQFDTDNCVAAEVYQVDGNSTGTFLYGGDHTGPEGSDANMHAPIVKGVGQVIRFRARCFGPDCDFAAIGIVFYE